MAEMRGRLSRRVTAFLSAADERGPRWEVLARRVFAPLALGLAIGGVLIVLASLVSAPWRWWGLVALCVVVLVWIRRQIRWSREQLRALEADLERLERLAADE